MKIKPHKFRVPEGKEIKLKKWPTRVKPFYQSKEDYQEILTGHIIEMSKLQNLLYANGSNALLLIFQAMDAAGKDGAIRHVMSGLNPQGCEVFSFKRPSATDLAHDFLWRTTVCLPERGRIGIFNRSYYEEVLIVRVHPKVLEGEKLPPSLVTKKIWEERFEDIRSFERHMARNGTVIRKFFLHLSKKEQKNRFLARLDEPEKNWKFSEADVHEREYWDEYQNAFEDMIRHTATKDAPWYVIPADNKWFAHLAVSAAIVETLEELSVAYPRVDAVKRKELDAARKLLGKK
jgi:PPK2 family polyphosphate:nucleotide phosphotransferase